MSNSDLKENLIKKRKPNRILHEEGFFGRFFFTQLNKIIRDGNEKPFTEDMLYYLEEEYLYSDYPKFRAYYEKNKKRYSNDFFHLAIRYTRKENIQKAFIYGFR